MIRVLVTDDEPLVRAGLRSILGAAVGLDVVGEAGDGREAADLAADLAADVVLMDVQMPGTDGVEGVRLTTAARPEARVLMLTLFDLDEHVYGALAAGASGYLLKSTPPDTLVEAVRAVHAGELLFAPSVTRRLVETYVRRTPRSPDRQRLETLTDRELEVFGLVARGLSNAEIAAELFLGQTTVKTHVARILTKLGLRDRVQAVVLAYESGFWEEPPG